MAKVKSLVKKVLMSIAAAFRFISRGLEPFYRLGSVGGGVIGYYPPMRPRS